MTRYTPVRQIKASERRPGMTYEFFEKRGKKVARRWAGLKGEMEALRREHMKAKRNPRNAGKYNLVDIVTGQVIQTYTSEAAARRDQKPMNQYAESHSQGHRYHVQRSKNPRAGQLLFRTRAAAVKYARDHGAKRFSVRKLRRA